MHSRIHWEDQGDSDETDQQSSGKTNQTGSDCTGNAQAGGIGACPRERCGDASHMLCNMERQTRQVLDFELVALADALYVSVDWLLGRDS